MPYAGLRVGLRSRAARTVCEVAPAPHARIPLGLRSGNASRLWRGLRSRTELPSSSAVRPGGDAEGALRSVRRATPLPARRGSFGAVCYPVRLMVLRSGSLIAAEEWIRACNIIWLARCIVPLVRAGELDSLNVRRRSGCGMEPRAVPL